MHDEDFVLLTDRNIMTDRNYASQTYWKGVFTRFFAKKRAVIGLVIVLVIAVLALLGPMLSPYSYREITSCIDETTGKEIVARGISPRLPWLHDLLGRGDYGDRFGAAREVFPGAAVLWMFVVALPWILLLPVRRIRWRSFPFLAVVAITGFWCLTSRALIYYLLPVVPLFAAGLALEGDRERLRRFAGPCAVLAVLVTAGAFAGGMLFTDNMRGAKTEFRVTENRYAYEFYHGPKDEAELRHYRELLEAWLREHPWKENK